MHRGDIIINPFVSPVFDDKPNPNYALIYDKRVKYDLIQVFDFTGEKRQFYCKKDEEQNWKVVGHTEITFMDKIKSFVKEWSELYND